MKCQLGAFLAIVHYGLGQDVSLSCPVQWVEGFVAVLNCSVKISQWRNPPCNIVYSTTLTFSRIPDTGTSLPVCSVTNANAMTCNGTQNAQGCGCTTNGSFYNFFYKVVANSAVLEKNSWECRPNCVASTTSMSVYHTKTCCNTHVTDLCDGNPCAPGTCTVVNNNRKCSCEGTYYIGETCKVDPCANMPPGSCLCQRKTGATAHAFAKFGYTYNFESCGAVTTNDNCNQLAFGFCIGAPSGCVFIIICVLVCFGMKLSFFKKRQCPLIPCGKEPISFEKMEKYRQRVQNSITGFSVTKQLCCPGIKVTTTVVEFTGTTILNAYVSEIAVQCLIVEVYSEFLKTGLNLKLNEPKEDGRNDQADHYNKIVKPERSVSMSSVDTEGSTHIGKLE